MKVENKEMYHFHHTDLFKDIWVPNNEIIVDDNFETSFLKILRLYNTAVNTESGKRTEFDKIIDIYLKTEQDKETYIKLLKESRRILMGASIFMREMALEEIRKQKYNTLPSRKHSIWLCDEKSKNFWNKELIKESNGQLDLYKVLVSGELFKSSDEFIPDNHLNYETMLKESEKYWDPVFENDKQEEKAEYLFQGKVKILEKIN